MPLEWRDATNSDRRALETFVCAPDDYVQVGYKRLPKYPWLTDVQKHIHTIGGAVSPPEYLLLGFDGHGLVAVANYWFDSESAACKVLVAACAVRAQQKGNGTELVRKVVERIRELHDDHIEFIWGLVDRRNVASKRLLQGCGFEFDSIDDDDIDLELWVLDL